MFVTRDSKRNEPTASHHPAGAAKSGRRGFFDDLLFRRREKAK
jgi:hypothetical protein|tara:strand:- start:2659 stop:2787 length:129 start_codon:yes stop_codon:yes gene_type:complete